jgi:hypothetical protein
MGLADILWLEGHDEVPMPATPERWSSWTLTHLPQTSRHGGYLVMIG